MKVPPRIIPIIKKTGFNNLVGNSILALVKAKSRLRPSDPNNQGRGNPITDPR